MVIKIRTEANIYYFLLFVLISIQLSNANEINHLLSFKSSLKDPTHSLSNWVNSTPLCTWNGITCSPNKTHVLHVNLSTTNISGSLSSSLFRLSYIESIDLSGNQLSGQIPQEVFSCLSLLSLNLSNNNFTGRIPGLKPESQSQLEKLDLSNNMITGFIPDGLGSLPNMRYLDIGGNALTGKIPESLSNMTRLEYLTLASNQLSGQIPSGLWEKLQNLKWVYLGYNSLSGKIPDEMGMLTSLNHLDLVYNNLTGSIPSSFGNLTNLKYLFLYQNKLNGSIPPPIFSLNNLISLDLSDNLLSGEIPQDLTSLKNLKVLHLFSNNLTGKIPDSISSLGNLQVLQLWSNSLSGHIPSNLGKNNNLTVLDLSTNSLSGGIPDSLCNSGYLNKLILFSNSLSGGIPPSLGSCHSLRRIRLQNNSLSGGFPRGFNKLKNVYFLDVSRNDLFGRIDEEEWEMPGLQMLSLAKNKFGGGLPNLSKSVQLENLDLSENHLSGIIPTSYGKLSNLMGLKLARNGITGPIPESLASCEKLVTLDLSQNKLSGPIPLGLGQMPVLGQLDLSENQLSGEIPKNLGAVDSLVEVNISYNHFHGMLPSTVAFLTINSSAVEGNDLCGGDHSVSGLPPCEGGAKGPNTTTLWWGLAASIIGFAIIATIFFVYLFVFIRKKRFLDLQRVENEEGVWEVRFFDAKASKAISIDDLCSTDATKNNKIKNDQFIVEDVNGYVISNNDVWEEISQYGKIRHPNVVKLLGASRFEKGGVLIYENYVQGNMNSLSQVLHGLSWVRRRKIALGIAKALKFLHYHCSPSLLVGEVSPERVVVGGEDEEARLKLSVGGLICLGSKSFLSSAYVAPEVKEAKEITDKNDIYGFGLVLIELLTGRGPTDAEFGAHEGIVGWARYCYSDCHLDTWIDPVIREQKLMNNQNEIVEIMNLALQCTASDPIARPCSSNVVKTLESIMRTRSCVLGMEISSK